MRRVVCELCRGFKEILLVSILLIVLIFVFACYGVHLFGGRLARCNDLSITRREDCYGVFDRSVFITRMKLKTDNNTNLPKLLVPRIWYESHLAVYRNILEYEIFGELDEALIEKCAVPGLTLGVSISTILVTLCWHCSKSYHTKAG